MSEIKDKIKKEIDYLLSLYMSECSDFNKLFEEFVKLSLNYGEQNVADAFFELDTFYFVYLSISGNKSTEKHIRKVLANNSCEDEVFDAAIGLVALGFKEGIEILKKFAYKKHPLLKHTNLTDISDYLKYIDNKLAIKLVEEIESGKYDSYWNIKKDKNPE